MSQREAFELMLKEDRYDEVTRKVYADWLSEHGFDDEALEQYNWTPRKQQAIDWIHDWEDKLGLERGELMNVNLDEPDEDYSFHVGDREMERDEFQSVQYQFFRELEIALGREENEESNYPYLYFSCSC